MYATKAGVPPSDQICRYALCATRVPSSRASTRGPY